MEVPPPMAPYGARVSRVTTPLKLTRSIALQSGLGAQPKWLHGHVRDAHYKKEVTAESRKIAINIFPVKYPDKFNYRAFDNEAYAIRSSFDAIIVACSFDWPEVLNLGGL